MDDDVLAALKIPFESGAVSEKGRMLFLNAVAGFPGAMAQQYDFIKARSSNATPEIPPGPFDTVLVRGAKNREETLYFIAAALEALRDGGTLAAAAANDGGGRRLAKDIASAGLAVHETSRHKCRVVWAQKDEKALRRDVSGAWLENGKMQFVLGGAFLSRPGIFGWDKIDAGSQLLAGLLPQNLSGAGADFGCGYGFLSRRALDNCPAIQRFFCIDSDARAVAACAQNLAQHAQKTTFLWDDATRPQPGLPPLDFILMNPPFHDDKKTAAALGQSFIASGAAALRPGGALWLVANAHLPYERLLGTLFKTVTPLAAAGGFKVYHAAK